MERKIFQLTEQQLRKCRTVQLPSDDEIKIMWAKAHSGKVAGWGMKKRDLALSALRGSPEYQRGMWQGRADAARGLDYSEERNDSAYNLGYHQGYTNYQSDRRGWDAATRQTFDDQYVSCGD